MRARTRAIVLSVGLALPALVIAGQAASGCFWSFDDCTLTAGFGCKGASSSSAGVSTGGAGGTGGLGGASSTSSNGTGGGSGCTAATAATVCPGPKDGPCMAFATKTCVNGKCGLTHTVMDVPSQKYGSCKKKICDGTGALLDIIDDTNVYDDGNPCTKKSCLGGVPGKVVPLTGAACTGMAMTGFCEPDPYSGVSACLQCDPLKPITSCMGLPNTSCDQGTCVPTHCSDMMKNSGEADIDCGNPASGCLKCSANKACLTYKDCATSVCTGGVCQAASCMDGRQNQDETDIDCGGKISCPPCGDTLGCLVASDCKSGVCRAVPVGVPNTCQPATCMDGVMNGDETGLDCGGTAPMCPPCGP